MTGLVQADSPDDAGVSLVELIVYAFVGAIILAVIAALFANGLRSQASTTERDTATGRAAVISNSLQGSIRNASEFRLEADKKTVRAKVATGASGWECRAWSLTTTGELKYKTSTSAIAIGSTTGWATLATGVTGTLAGAVTFGESGRTLSYGLQISVAGQVVPVTGGVTAQATIEGTGACW